MRKWMYKENEGQIFEDGEDIPADYVDCPSKAKKQDKKPTKEDTVEKPKAVKKAKKRVKRTAKKKA